MGLRAPEGLNSALAVVKDGFSCAFKGSLWHAKAKVLIRMAPIRNLPLLLKVQGTPCREKALMCACIADWTVPSGPFPLPPRMFRHQLL